MKWWITMVFMVAMVWGALGCAETLPAHAAYVPADCPKGELGPLFVDDAAEPRPPEAEEARQTKETKREAPARMKLDPKEAPGEARVDLNAATQAQLEALPGIGPSLAGRIIARREKRPFRRVSQLRRVKGIGPAKYRELKDLVRVE
jgi:competence ComEA-like helix-hairpin-helix protein